MYPDKIQKLLDRYFGIPLVCSLGLPRASASRHKFTNNSEKPDTQYATRNTQHVTRNTQHATRNTQHVTRNTQHVTRIANHKNGDLFAPNSISKSKTEVFRRILFIQISAIGDVILLTPALRAIRERFPHVRLTMVASPINRQLIKNCPYIDEILTFRMDECAKSPRRFFSFARSLREGRFDLAIDFEHWPRLTALLAYLSGAPRRIGFRTAGQYRHYVFTDTVEHVRGKHELLSFLDIARLLGCNIENTELEVWPCLEDFNWVEQFLKGHGIKEDVPLIGIHPDAGRAEPRRRWTKEGYQQVADALAKRYGAQIVLTGAPSEVELSKQIASMMRAEAIIAAGKTDINQLAALFSRCQFVLCGNCGPMHLAAAVKTPVVALHGPTNPAQWGPWGEGHTIICSDMPCSPCLNLGFEYSCKPLPDGTSPCMRTIAVETVLSACERQLLTST